MSNSIKNALKKLSKFQVAFAAILIVGIFLRTYNFHDWLRFNADQGRDSALVSSVIEGKSSWPLLGPKAGGTDFKLGGVFYYFQIVSAKLFGNNPEKMAYPDLLAGILSMPLLFFLLRKYFDRKYALAAMALLAVSVYAIRYARFAWNPNSTPFWTMLVIYSLHEIFMQKQNRKFLWAIIGGIAAGIAIQLHTTILIFLPIFIILTFAFFCWKNVQALKYFFVILVMALMLNIPQFVHEYQTGGANALAFLQSIHKKQESATLGEKIVRSSSCFIQANSDILVGWEISDICNWKVEKNIPDTIVFVLASLFVLGGFVLAVRFFRREQDSDKKSFLVITGLYVVSVLALFVPIAFELSMRFYLILMFAPFLLLGFWFQYINEFAHKYSKNILTAVLIVLFAINGFFVKEYFAFFASYADDGGTVNIATLSQVENFANFMIKHSQGSKKVMLDGNEKFLFKAFKPMKYFTERAGMELLPFSTTNGVPAHFFYIARKDKKELLLKSTDIVVQDQLTWGKFTILSIEVK